MEGLSMERGMQDENIRRTNTELGPLGNHESAEAKLARQVEEEALANPKAVEAAKKEIDMINLENTLNKHAKSFNADDERFTKLNQEIENKKPSN